MRVYMRAPYIWGALVAGVLWVKQFGYRAAVLRVAPFPLGGADVPVRSRQ